MLADPVSFTFGLLLIGGLALVVAVMRREWQTYDPMLPAVRQPLSHVVPVRLGTCRECGTEGVPVHRYSHHILLDPDDVCDGCMKALTAEPGLAGGEA